MEWWGEWVRESAVFEVHSSNLLSLKASHVVGTCWSEGNSQPTLPGSQEQESGDVPDIGQGPQMLCHSGQARDKGMSETYAQKARRSHDKGQAWHGWHGTCGYMSVMTRSTSGSDPSPSCTQPGPTPRCFSPDVSRDAMHHMTQP